MIYWNMPHVSMGKSNNPAWAKGMWWLDYRVGPVTYTSFSMYPSLLNMLWSFGCWWVTSFISPQDIRKNKPLFLEHGDKWWLHKQPVRGIK